MQLRPRFFGILLLLLAGGFYMVNERDRTIAGQVHQPIIKKDIPLMDKIVPAVTETATFAMG